MILKQIYLTHVWVLPFRVRVNQRVMVEKEPHHQMKFTTLAMTPFLGEGCYLQGIQAVYSLPCRQGNEFLKIVVEVVLEFKKKKIL